MANNMMKGNNMSVPPPILQQQNNKGMIVGAVAYGHQQQQQTKSNVNTMIKPDMTQPPPTLGGATAAQHNGHNAQNAMAMNSDRSNSTLANTKEKTPMCLINELARYNKIQHQYTLVDEKGPAHDKNFYVKLKLGEEEYDSEGGSIKKAQHAAAELALQKTAFKHPPPKPPKTYNQNLYVSANNITPTVELNALAMKRGEPAIYHTIEPHRPQYYPAPNYDYRGMCNQRYHYPRMPRIFTVKLKVGEHREFIGEGPTRQAARHCAADRALKVLNNLPMPSTAVNTEDGVGMSQPQQQKQQMMSQQPQQQQPGQGQPPVQPQSQMMAATPEAKTDEDKYDELKSEISLVHEIALKRKMSVNFEVKSESGPPHMRTFITLCTVGDFVTEGIGNSKKVSKKCAAQKMYVELKKLPPLPPTIAIARPKPRNALPGNKKKNRNLIKMQKADPGYGVGINPISRLIQIQQAKKEREPIYTLEKELGQPRRREFVMQVTVGNQSAQGKGPNKKLAKRNAAEAMLQLLGYSRPAPQPSKPAIKSTNGEVAGDNKKVTFVENEAAVAGRQLVPGVLLMPDSVRQQPHGHGMIKPGMYQVGESMVSAQTTSIIAKELLDHGISPTSETLRKDVKPGQHQANLLRPKQQLLYLAEILGFQVPKFTDFPKNNNKNEFLSLVSLATNPPQVSHGAGPTKDASHDAASLAALKALADMAMNMDKKGAGDGPPSMKVMTKVDKK